MSMFCYQCEQTAKGCGCTVSGVCGKSPETAALQDLLVHIAEGVSQYALRARKAGASTTDADHFVVEALFSTVTNVDFDPVRIEKIIRRGAKIRESLKSATGGETLAGDGMAEPAADMAGLVTQGQAIGIAKRTEALGADVTGLQELITYGLKGMAAYVDHACVLGVEKDEVYAFIHEALDFLAGNPADVDSLVAMAMKVGEINLTVMGMLDQANTGVYGHPEPTSVRVTPVAGKAICVSGHDLKDLELLLQQTEGKGV
ncbi:MAG: hydroxylamine reductase, partial [Planctomycetes bacterium]|nr:hydroxylamine reductase [Planctomycetota bacterium]